MSTTAEKKTTLIGYSSSALTASEFELLGHPNRMGYAVELKAPSVCFTILRIDVNDSVTKSEFQDSRSDVFRKSQVKTYQ